MKRIAVLTSGGDSPGMNAAIRAVVRCGIDEGLEVYGVERGYEGLIEGDIRPMTRRDVGDILQRGGTVLKTARCPEFKTARGMEKAMSKIMAFEIEGLVCIGGDGTFRGALELSKRGIKIMALPGTIDNDLGYTDFTIGFDTAVTTVLEAIGKIRDTSSSHERTTVIEVMGRECGDIALYAGLSGGAETVLLPEKDYDINELCKKILMSVNSGKLHSIIIKSEGSRMDSGTLVSEIQRITGRETKLVVLSYLQRGGTPTMRDRLLATSCASKAVSLLSCDSESKAIGSLNGEIMAFDLEEAVKVQRNFNQEMFDLIEVLSK
ncbi:MAG: 6-phosphofructokinase [Hornefia sp.]|nr:6-phosphofructokinase [Hornefia sp.]